MRPLAILLALATVGCSNQPKSGAPGRDTAESANANVVGAQGSSPDLAARADSLARLDPEREARAAMARGDLGFIAVCGYACEPVGVPMDSAQRSPDSLALRSDSLRRIEGTSDAVVNQDVERLNRVAREYASRYNAVIWERRKELRKK